MSEDLNDHPKLGKCDSSAEASEREREREREGEILRENDEVCEIAKTL